MRRVVFVGGAVDSESMVCSIQLNIKYCAWWLRQLATWLQGTDEKRGADRDREKDEIFLATGVLRDACWPAGLLPCLLVVSAA